jgi:2,4-dienoyl-CoA reductase-like NADH-dependent reductase (Old Yellow Enzyme family)
LPLEVTEAVIGVWGADRVGYRISPKGAYNSMSDSHPIGTFSYLDACAVAVVSETAAMADKAIAANRSCIDRSMALPSRHPTSCVTRIWVRFLWPQKRFLPMTLRFLETVACRP